MQSYTFSVCRPCRQALSRQFHSSLPVLRSTKAYKTRRKRVYAPIPSELALPRSPPTSRRMQPSPPLLYEMSNAKPTLGNVSRPLHIPTGPSPEAVRKILLRHISPWKSASKTVTRFTSLGLSREEVETLLQKYKSHIIEVIKSEVLQGEDPWSIAHLLNDDTLNEEAIADRVFTMRFFEFAAQPGLNIKGVCPASMNILRHANQAFDLRYIQEAFSLARKIRRKIYLHVGPTNSGKTYNALCALSNARSGVYAGPLRLLAHEVWERLNRGSIRPHGTDPADAHRFARQCNLVTGEEQRIVSDLAPLTSCTVEMLNLYGHYSVCVIDEIQMIADPERGHAWTTAVLGVPAEEVHLCGEETVVPLITELVRETGDDLEIKRYQRLTPLEVAKESLQGRWDLIRKGDCIVTFSRSSIFAMKRIVEEATGLRCAVAYGRLPPETRSEQAALFNAPDSGYDVMVASDAIGMGLNLKIKRVVFTHLTKFNGTREVPLSLSQIKQIGGRAGRFGEYGDATSVGIVTCLNEDDLPILEKAFSRKPPILGRAYLPLHGGVLSKVAQFLPESFGLKSTHSLLSVAARVGKNYSIPEIGGKVPGMDLIDHFAGELLLGEKLRFLMSPTSWRATAENEVFVQYLRQFVKNGVVDLRKAIQETGLLETLALVNETRLRHEQQATGESNEAIAHSVHKSSTLAVLETLHRVLVTYAWLSYRIPISFDQRGEVAKLKEETERCIEYVLEGIANVKKLQRGQGSLVRELREKDMDNQIAFERRRVKIPRVLERTGLVRRPETTHS